MEANLRSVSAERGEEGVLTDEASFEEFYEATFRRLFTARRETEWSPDGDQILYQLSKPEDRLGFVFDSEVWTIGPDGSNAIKIFESDGCDMGEIADALPVWAPNGTQLAYNDCGTWVVANADGSGEAQAIDEAVYRS